MMPEAAIVAFSGSVSNHWSRKSAALMVMSWRNVAWCRSGRARNRRARRTSGSHGRGSSRPGSGGTMERIGLMNRAMSTMSCPYSSYASASVRDHLRSSRMVRPWSLTLQRKSASSGVNVPSSGRISSPCLGSSSSRMISGRSRLTTYEATLNRKPGKTSSVTVAPPRRCRRSTTRVRRPPLAR